MNTGQFINTSRPLSRLRPLLGRWSRLHRQYIRYWDGQDCGWWYNERASIGVLAVAAWRAGEVALEEYSTEKGPAHSRYSGRCDLYFTVGKLDYAAEAKHVWVPLGRGAVGLHDVEANLRQACQDARRPSDPVARRIGIVFAVPRFPPSDPRDCRQALASWLARVRSIKADAVCWVGPPRGVQWPRGQDAYVYPGVALVARLTGVRR
jgi:hypothetical protein